MKTTFPLQEVIEDIVNAEKSLSSALMKLSYFGRLINNDELINYTSKELNGYNVNEEVPEYRKSIGKLRIEMQAYTHTHHGVLPVSMLEEPFKSIYKYVKVREGISSIEQLGKEATLDGDSNKEIGVAFPMEMLRILQTPARKLYQSDVRIDVVGATLCTSKNIIVEIPNAIRTKLLDFVMSIAKEFGYYIEIETFNKNPEINNQTINNYMSTTINNNGDGNLINTGNHNKIENNVQINKGDLKSLQEELRNQGIDEIDIQEISTIVSEETPDLENNRLGTRANSWITNIMNKSLNGIGKISTGITVNLLATLVKGYFGIV
ncbi:hypothetical protein SAMN05421594_0729 [Chryseobacterium oleae]|uniref:AbiTii domain-containing protein n=1 Tax=Chryseobacterium oleae TaxID=491207 RepID=A0A1I4VXV2_CHROL|nr:hypothetical protein [Chryseobacterium oleae]SFN06124.1 hypothetical protein SAMN05421594_0729 [Chryseobacterium oleae]